MTPKFYLVRKKDAPDGVALYYGTDSHEAILVLSENSGAKLDILDQPDPRYEKATVDENTNATENVFSKALTDLLDKLESLPITEAGAEHFKNIEKHAEKIVAEVNHIGIKGMKVVGEGFINFGELISKFASKEASKETPPQE